MLNLIEKIGRIFIKIYTVILRFSTKIENLFLFNFLLYIKYQFFPIINNFYLPTYLLEGKEKYGKKNLKVLFCGNRNSLEYIIDLLFFEKPQLQFLGKFLFKKAYQNIHNYSNSVDLMILKTDRFFYKFLQKKGFIIIPEWIPLRLDISKPLEEIIKNFKRSAKEDINKIKKYSYSYEITSDVEKFNHFFYKIRRPFFSKRVGEQALPGSESYYDIFSGFKNGTLFLLKNGEQYVAGTIIIFNKNSINLHFLGIIEYPYMDQGAGSALTYSLICWAKKQQFDRINFGLTRPFLNDGSFRFKRKWGMTIKADYKFHSVFALKIKNFDNDSVYDLLENNPLIYYMEGKYVGVIFIKELGTTNSLNEIQKKYYIPGLSHIVVIKDKKELRNMFV